jgi:hypothetical protein
MIGKKKVLIARQARLGLLHRRTSRGVCLIGVHLIGVHLMGVHLMGVCLKRVSHRRMSYSLHCRHLVQPLGNDP